MGMGNSFPVTKSSPKIVGIKMWRASEMVTRAVVQGKLLDYLNRYITLAELVDWAETVMMDGEFDERDVDLLTEIVARLGLADVREFGLSWEDCYEFLARLGYHVQVTTTAA